MLRYFNRKIGMQIEGFYLEVLLTDPVSIDLYVPVSQHGSRLHHQPSFRPFRHPPGKGIGQYRIHGLERQFLRAAKIRHGLDRHLHPQFFHLVKNRVATGSSSLSICQGKLPGS